MAAADNLWSNSRAWRWTLITTLLATALALLGKPWLDNGASTAVSPAQYHSQSAQAVQTAQTAQMQSGSSSTHSAAGSTRAPPDAEFDTAIALPSGTYSSDTELHAIGVYEAALPNGQQEKPWFSHCTAFTEDQQAMMECHSKYANQHPMRSITVYLNRTQKPVILALMAYEPIRWKVVSRPGVDLRRVILGGYYGQDVEGLTDSTPVELHSYESTGNCINCTRHADYFYAYKERSSEYQRSIDRLQQLTGLVPSSFQGAYRAASFSITTALPAKAASPSQEDEFSGKTFSNYLRLGGQTLLLPDGTWRALGYVANPSSRGEDHFLVLAQEQGSRLSALLAVRLQVVSDGQGFPRYRACEKQADYHQEVRRNEAFGEQLCYWSSHVADPWQQPLFRLAATRLQTDRSALPANAIATGFRKTDSSSSLTTLYYAFPDEPAQAATSAWNSSPWNPARITAHPQQAAFLQQRLDWAAGWFQIFAASR